MTTFESSAVKKRTPEKLGGVILLAWFLILASIAGYFWLIDVPSIRSSAGPVWVALVVATGLAAYCWPRDTRKRTRIAAGGVFGFAAFAIWAFFVAARLPSVSAPAIGQSAPAAEFVAVDGQKTTVAEAVQAGPLLLVFYRGHW